MAACICTLALQGRGEDRQIPEGRQSGQTMNFGFSERLCLRDPRWRHCSYGSETKSSWCSCREPCSVPSTHIKQLTIAHNSNSKETDTLYWIPQELTCTCAFVHVSVHTCAFVHACVRTCAHMCMHIKEQKIKANLFSPS